MNAPARERNLKIFIFGIILFANLVPAVLRKEFWPLQTYFMFSSPHPSPAIAYRAAYLDDKKEIHFLNYSRYRSSERERAIFRKAYAKRDKTALDAYLLSRCQWDDELNCGTLDLVVVQRTCNLEAMDQTSGLQVADQVVYHRGGEL